MWSMLPFDHRLTISYMSSLLVDKVLWLPSSEQHFMKHLSQFELEFVEIICLALAGISGVTMIWNCWIFLTWHSVTQREAFVLSSRVGFQTLQGLLGLLKMMITCRRHAGLLCFHKYSASIQIYCIFSLFGLFSFMQNSLRETRPSCFSCWVNMYILNHNPYIISSTFHYLSCISLETQWIGLSSCCSYVITNYY